MVKMDKEIRKEQVDLETKERSIIEYHTFKLCKLVVESYKQKVELWEQKTKDEELIDNTPNITERYGFRKTIIILQYLIGENGSYKFPVPQTLETALQSAGIDNQTIIDKEVAEANKYLQLARSLNERYMTLAEKQVDLTYHKLTAKSHSEGLTPDEAKRLEDICEILSSQH